MERSNRCSEVNQLKKLEYENLFTEIILNKDLIKITRLPSQGMTSLKMKRSNNEDDKRFAKRGTQDILDTTHKKCKMSIPHSM